MSGSNRSADWPRRANTPWAPAAPLWTFRLYGPFGLFGLLGLGGCVATHVGTDWQCPLAQGSVCTRVAAADPAAPDRVSPGAPVEAEAATNASEARRPRYRTGTAARTPAARAVARVQAPDSMCEGNCRPQDRLGSETAGRNTDGALRNVDAELRDSARTAEVIGRIWIAPYVDARGVYHEASWVRAVLEPAGWRREP